MGQTVSDLTSWLWEYLSTPPKKGEPGHETRQKALAQANLAKQASAQSQLAYHRNDHQAAAHYSQLSKSHWKEHNRLQALAEREIFTSHNPEYPKDLQRVDLHGLFVKEAQVRVEQHVQLCRRAGITRTVVITGQGNHSRGGLAKLKPAITELCEKENLRVLMDRPNPGCITVLLMDLSNKTSDRGNCVII
jgi:DNA-nicking Smr family endonuclease